MYLRVFGASSGLGLVRGHRVEPRALFDSLPGPPANAVDRIIYFHPLTYLPYHISLNLDRAPIAVSLETRMPFLDHRIVEFAWSLPQQMLLRNGVSKWAMREVLARYVPHALTERPKAGFGIPLAEWLRGPLREWADEMLSPSSLHVDGYLDADAVGNYWTAHTSRRRDHTNVLWNVLMFQSWLRSLS